MSTPAAELLTVATIIAEQSLSIRLDEILQPALGDGIAVRHFGSVDNANEYFSQASDEERENCVLLIVSHDSSPLFQETLAKIANEFVPHSRKIVFLSREHACDVIELSNQSMFDRFHFYPLQPSRLVTDMEVLIEKFLENKILRRSLLEIRETYERMKIQLKTIQEANLRLDKKIMELSTLSEIGSDLIATYDEEEILRETALTLMGQKGASYVIIMLLNERDNVLEINFLRGNLPQNVEDSLKFLAFGPLMNSIFKASRAQFLSHIEISEASEKEFDRLANYDIRIIIPLINKGQRKGIVLLGKKINETDYSDDDFEFFSVLSNQMIFALENAHLYEKLQAKISELERANKELLKLDRMKSEFITIASHELRTPLTAVRGYAELLLSGKFGDVSTHQQKALEVMNKNVDRLIQISDDVVQLSKIDADRISINLIPSAIEKIVHDIVEDIKPVIESRSQNLELEIAENCPVVLIDPVLINQALAELIKNAIRFTPDGGNIVVEVLHVDVDSLPREKLPAHHFGSFVSVKVTDDGIGIPSSEYEHIFERFYEVQHSNYHHSGTFGFRSGGTGLGLAIVKGIIEKHGGKIWVVSWMDEKKRGSEFTFIIPTPSFV